MSFKSCASHLFSSMYINIRYICINLTLVSLCIIIQFKQINQLDATVLQVYYLRFMCRSTCFGRLHLHQQELTTALTASGFTVGALVVAALLVVVWPVRRPGHDQQSCYHQRSNSETRGCQCSCKLLLMEVEAPKTC